MFGNGFRARVGAAFCAASSAGFHLYCVPSASPLRHDCMIVWNVLASSHASAFPPPITSPKSFQQVLSCVCFPSELMREADARCKPEKRRSSGGGARGLTMAALPKHSLRKRACLVGAALTDGGRLFLKVACGASHRRRAATHTTPCGKLLFFCVCFFVTPGPFSVPHVPIGTWGTDGPARDADRPGSDQQGVLCGPRMVSGERCP